MSYTPNRTYTSNHTYIQTYPYGIFPKIFITKRQDKSEPAVLAKSTLSAPPQPSTLSYAHLVKRSHCCSRAPMTSQPEVTPPSPKMASLPPSRFQFVIILPTI
ncbi:hypothetical protein E2C01_019549 [Portunus trituberculatus]|uniref:Uncharacterized protein n=1 Tax=Portunus trituberculatus TaxID=210409 RepID=A0A5B7DXX6_PORTR|nr:hypothetical protein [Portunus trituberculatus]